MRNQEWDAALAKLYSLNLAQLVLCLLGCDAVDGEAALGVVDEAEVLASLLNGDDIHQTGGEGGVGADLAVNLDEALHEDGIDLASVERVLQAVAEKYDQRQRVAELVRTGGGLGSVGTCNMSVLISQCRILRRLQELRVPDSLSRSQCEGALRRFWCLTGPRAILTVV